MSGQSLLVALVGALGLGSVYALVALSFTLVYSATGYIHVGMGAFVTVGAVGAYVGTVSLGWSWPVTGVVVAVVGAVLGVVSEIISVRPIRGRASDDHSAVIVSTLAFMIVVSSVISLWFGTDELRVPAYIVGEPFRFGDVPVRRVFVVMTLALALVATTLELIIRRTETGRVLRASQDDPVGVELMGVSFRRVVLVTFGLAGLLGALAGLLISPVSYASPFVGADLLIFGFAAMAIGGFGSFAGAIAGALLIGTVTSFSPLFLRTQFTKPLILLLVLVILFARPTGLLGRSQLRAV